MKRQIQALIEINSKHADDGILKTIATAIQDAQCVYHSYDMEPTEIKIQPTLQAWLEALPNESYEGFNEACRSWINTHGSDGGCCVSTQSEIEEHLGDEEDQNNVRECARIIYQSVADWSASPFDALSLTIDLISDVLTDQFRPDFKEKFFDSAGESLFKNEWPVVRKRKTTDSKPLDPRTERLSKLTPDELADVLARYDEYIQNANEENRYEEGWMPVCVAEFIDCEYSMIVEERHDDPEGEFRQPEPKWSEIRNDFYDEIKECTCIDAWETASDNEGGIVIARVYDDGTVEYIDPDAMTDKEAQAAIRETLIKVLDKLRENTD